jgi:hypothetical protein
MCIAGSLFVRRCGFTWFTITSSSVRRFRYGMVARLAIASVDTIKHRLRFELRRHTASDFLACLAEVHHPWLNDNRFSAVFAA